MQEQSTSAVALLLSSLSQFPVTFIGVAVLLILILLAKPKTYRGIPEIAGYPIFGIVHLLTTITGSFRSHYEVLEILLKIGPISQANFLGQNLLIINDPAVLKAAFDKIRGKGIFHQAAFSSQNIFSLDTNEAWKSRRHTFRHAFNVNILRHFDHTMKRLSSTLSNIIDEHIAAKKVLVIDHLFGKFALDVIYNIGFEIDHNFMRDEASYNELYGAILQFFEYSFVPALSITRWMSRWNAPLPPIRKFLEARAVIQKYQRLVLKTLLEKHQKKQFVSDSFGKLFMEYAEKEQLTEDEMLSELFLFIVAGHETTAHTLSWTIYAMACNPELQKKCQAIASEDWNKISTEEQQNSVRILPEFLEATIKETFRKYPAASRGSMRQVQDKEGVELSLEHLQLPNGKAYPKSVHLPYGAWVWMNIFTVQNSTTNWGEDANEFKPERWLQSSEINMNSPASYAGGGNMKSNEIAFAPFSYGVRNCLGMNMALWEIRTIFSRLLRCYHFELADPSLKDESIALQTDVTMKPKDGLPVIVTKRD